MSRRNGFAKILLNLSPRVINCHDPSPENITQLNASGLRHGATYKSNLISSPSVGQSTIIPHSRKCVDVFNGDGDGDGLKVVIVFNLESEATLGGQWSR